MLKIVPITALALGLSSGVALADRHGGDHREHGSPRGGVVVRDHHDDHRGGSRAVVIRDRGNHGDYGRHWNGNGDYGRHWNNGGRVVVRGPSYQHVVRRPIYVSRPVIRQRYYNYYRRPTVLVENYSAMPGYYWVAGAWSWNGGEWIWTPGHYEPDADYVDPAYYDNY